MAALDDRPHGGTAHLLELVRTASGAAAVFVATYLGDDRFAAAAVPVDGGLAAGSVDRLVRAAWADPELRVAPSLTRTAAIEEGDGTRQSVVVIVPLRDDLERWPRGLLGVVDPRGGSLGSDHLDLVTGVSRRLAAYLRARGDLLGGRSEDAVPDGLDVPADREAF